MSFIDTFKQMTEGYGIPDDYEFWASLWCVGSIVGRSVVTVNKDGASIFLNPMIVMVSSKGFMKERQVMDFCADVVAKASLNNPVKREGTIGKAVMQHHYAFGVGHVAMVRDNYPMTGRAISNTALPEYAIPGTDAHYANHYVTFMTNASPEQMKKTRPEFWPHLILVSRKSKLATVGGLDGIEASVRQLRQIRENGPALSPVYFTAQAEAFLANYYSTARHIEGPYAEAFASTFDTHVRRTSALIALCDLRGICTQQDVVTGLDAVLKARRYGEYLYADSSGSGLAGARRVRELLTNGPQTGTPERALYQQVRRLMPSHEFKNLLATMVLYGLIVGPYKIKGVGNLYIANNKLKDDVAWMEVLRVAGYGYETE